MNNASFNIAAVERDTGLSKDVLRMWERRYGFPLPSRDANGERSYTPEQVERLRLIKRLMDQGHRPGKLIATSVEELSLLAPRRAAQSGAQNGAPDGGLDGLIELIVRHDGPAYLQAMQQRLGRKGLERFVQDTVAPLAQRVGLAWAEGSVEVFEEHLFTELTKRLLRQAIAALPSLSRSPRILLTTVPNEAHVLGLLMVEALYALEGAECIALGTEMPLVDIGRAASAHRADIVALSFSTAFPQRLIPGLLEQLRLLLPPGPALWAGGGGVQRLAKIEGVSMLPTLDAAVAALADWRAART